MNTLSLTQFGEDLRNGNNILIVVESRAQASGFFGEIGGMKNPSISSLYCHGGVYELNSFNDGELIVISTGDFPTFNFGEKKFDTVGLEKSGLVPTNRLEPLLATSGQIYTL